ncbi:MAG: response regulator [Candidatus Latescibacterota bacterium]|jgi:CheY-like chemotaxis protein
MNKKATILIVDDDPDIIEQLTIIIKSEGYEVVAAGGQEEAEKTLMAVKPDLAVIDLMMEEMDSGFVLAHEIKKLYPGTPVILLTSVKSATGLSFAAASPDQQSWIKADRFLDKPVRPEQLKNELSRLLNHD